MSRAAQRRACNSANRALDRQRLVEPLDPNRDMGDSARRLREVFGVGGNDQLLRTDEIAREFRFPSAEAARKFINRRDIPREYRGRILLVDRRDFVHAMAQARKSRLRGVA